MTLERPVVVVFVVLVVVFALLVFVFVIFSAPVVGNLRVLLPMISGKEMMRAVKVSGLTLTRGQ